MLPGRSGVVTASRDTTRMPSADDVAVKLLASLTLTLKLELPAVVGVPEMVPVALFRLKPGGRLTDTIDHA